MVSKLAKNKDAAHIRRMKKVRPKQRFKTLSKLDQYIVAGRALAKMLDQERRVKGKKFEWSGMHIVVNKLKPCHIETDPTTGLLTQSAIMKIKRAMANAIKRILGPDTAFIMAIEYQNKVGAPIEPHVHIIAIKHLFRGALKDVRAALHRVAGNSDSDTVDIQYLSKHPGYKRHLERIRNEADFRRTAGYGAKNEDSRFYRSKAVIAHIPETWESLKTYYLRPAATKSS